MKKAHGAVSEVASLINTISSEKINCFSICSKNEIIPSSKHLEEMVLVNEDDIYNSIINNINMIEIKVPFINNNETKQISLEVEDESSVKKGIL